MQVSNTLDIEITAALVAADRVEVQRAYCSHLPWLDHDLSVRDRARAVLESALNAALGGFAEARNRAAPEPLLDGADKELSALLREYGVVVDFRPQLRLEEHAPELAEKLLVGLDDEARARLLIRLTEERVSWVPFEDVLEANADELTAKDFQHSAEAVAIELGQAASLTLKSSKSVLLRGIAISFADEAIAERRCSIVLGEEPQQVELPEIPVRAYRSIKSKDGVVALELRVGSEERRIGPIELRLTVPELDGSPLALFVDLGSTTTKMLSIALPAGEEPSDSWSAALQRRLHDAAHDKLAPDDLLLPAPQPTPNFLSDRGLPMFDKEELDKKPPAELAGWLASAIRALAQLAARERGSLISHVFWSFPQTGERDFAVLNSTVAELAGAVVLDRVHVSAEHECLRRRFAGVLEQLSSSAQQREKEQRQALRKNEELRNKKEREWDSYRSAKKDYDDTNWFWCLVTGKKKPSKPGNYHEEQVPSLEIWHRQFIELQVRPGLDEVLILDAGGFSLDAYARVRHGAKFEEFTGSFAAGGVRMTERAREILSAQRGCLKEEVSWDEAENIKRETCISDEHAGLSVECRELTMEIYSPALCEVAGWIRDRIHSHGLPLILTGGAMANRFLRELLVAVLKEHGVSSTHTTSVELVHLIQEKLPSNEVSSHALFSAVACAFGPKTDPRLHYDVLGGLVQYAAGSGKSTR